MGSINEFNISGKKDLKNNDDLSFAKTIILARNSGKRRSFRNTRKEKEPSQHFSEKPNYKWLYEPSVIKNQQYQDSFDDWTRSVFSKHFLKFTKYNLLLLLVSKHCSLPTTPLYASELHNSTSSLNEAGTNSLSTSSTNIRLLAQKQQEDLKLYATKRRLSGSMFNLLSISDSTPDVRQVLPNKPPRYAMRKK